MNLYILTGTTVAAALAIFAFLTSRLVLRSRSQDSGQDCLHDFSIETYRPMERLLKEADYSFLAQQPGFQPSIAKALRIERVKIFRMYLREMIADFNSLIRAAKIMLVYAPQDRPDFALAISRLQYEFYWHVVATEIRLSLSPWVNVKTSPSSLITLLDRTWLGVRETSASLDPSVLRALSTNS